MGNYICPECLKSYRNEEAIWRCSCGSYLNYNQTEKLQREEIIKDRASLWRYEKVLPLAQKEIVTQFAEGLTPLVKGSWSGIEVYFKLDYLMPSGSFKDRGSTVLINYLAGLGIERLIEDSSGNAGASIATYSTAAGIECEIYVPADTSTAKLVQIEMMGARLRKIEGTREEVAEAAIRAGEKGFYGSHNWHPLFIEGTKTLAYEIWEQSGFTSPDQVVVPVGMGSSLLGIYKGFKELFAAGEVDHMPRLLGIQAENCAPLYYLEQGLQETFQKRNTVAEGIACAKPLRTKELLTAVRETGGFFEIVNEDQIITALKKAALNAFFIEPTSAVALAGLEKLIAWGRVKKDERVVVLLTGNGLKATAEIASMTK